ncbi:MAG: hypothetical protein IKF71_05190 [Bacilli bacterium]|nr:hypothetical protein [Bacilli bacterium]
MRLNSRELKTLAIVIAVWGFFLISSGTVMSQSKKVEIKKTYSIAVSAKQISKIQARKTEISLKDLQIEEGSPISTNIKDYLDNPESISDSMLNLLSQGLDTSNVNVNKPGTYTYTITYKKKTYQAKIIVKEKALQNIKITLKEKNMPTTGTISRNIKDYIYEDLEESVYNEMILDLKDVIEHQNVPGKYKYSIIYKDKTYYGDFIIHEPVETVVTALMCPENSTADVNNNTCICDKGIYDMDKNICD